MDHIRFNQERPEQPAEVQLPRGQLERRVQTVQLRQPGQGESVYPATAERRLYTML